MRKYFPGVLVGHLSRACSTTGLVILAGLGLLSSQAFADLAFDQYNSTFIDTSSTPTTYYYPIVDATGNCLNPVIYGNSNLGGVPLDPRVDANTGPIFVINTGSKKRKDIAGTPDSPGDNTVSVYAEIESGPGVTSPVPLTLFDPDGKMTYSRSGDTYYLNYKEDAEVKVGIRLQSLRSPGSPGSLGICPAAGTGDWSAGSPPSIGPQQTFCMPKVPPQTGTPRVNVKIKLGIVSTYNQFNGFGGVSGNASSNSEFKEFYIKLASCPPNTTGTGAGAVQAPTLSIAPPTPGDTRVFITNNSVQPSDPEALARVLVYASTTQPFTYADAYNAGLIRAFDGPTGKYTFENLTNNTTYYFSLGYVNRAGFATTGTDWGGASNLPQSGGSYPSATPLPISGFLENSTCFIATAAYGTEFEPKLTILRAFRDEMLLKTSGGRALVEWYYSWSPQAAMWLKDHPGYRAMVRVFLAPVVEAARAALWLREKLWIMVVVMVLGTAAVVYASTRSSRREGTT